MTVLLAISAHAESWKITEIDRETVLFEKPQEHLKAVLRVEAVPWNDVSDYLLSSKFLQDGRNSRTPKALEVLPDGFEVNVTREQVGSTWIGVTESKFGAGDYWVLMSERWWVRNGFSYHFIIGQRKASSLSSRDLKNAFDEFTAELGLIPKSKKNASAFMRSMIPSVYAAELGRSRTRPLVANAPTGPTAKADINGQPLITDCVKQAESIGLEPGNVHAGPPDWHFSPTGNSCQAGALRIVDDVKNSILGAAQEVGAQAAKNAAIAKCDQMVLKVPKDTPTWQKIILWSGQADLAQAQSNCYAGAGLLAVGQYAVKAVTPAVQMLEKAAYYTMTPQGQMKLGEAEIHLTIRFAKFLQDGGDPMTVIGHFIQRKFSKFGCLKPEERAIVACKFVENVAKDAGLMALTFGAGAYIRAAKISTAFAEAFESLETADKASQFAKARRFQKVAEDIRLSARGRATLAEKALKRKLTKAERDAVEAAHKLPSSPLGKYTDLEMKKLLRAKLKILKQAGFSREEREAILRTGLAGSPVNPAKTAALIAAADHELETPPAGAPPATTAAEASVPKPGMFSRLKAKFTRIGEGDAGELGGGRRAPARNSAPGLASDTVEIYRRTGHEVLDHAESSPEARLAKSINGSDSFGGEGSQFIGSVHDVVQKEVDLSEAQYAGGGGSWRWWERITIAANESLSPLRSMYGDQSERIISWSRRQISATKFNELSYETNFDRGVTVATNRARVNGVLKSVSKEVFAVDKNGELQPFFYVNENDKFVLSRTFRGHPVKDACLSCHHHPENPTKLTRLPYAVLKTDPKLDRLAGAYQSNALKIIAQEKLTPMIQDRQGRQGTVTFAVKLKAEVSGEGLRTPEQLQRAVAMDKKLGFDADRRRVEAEKILGVNVFEDRPGFIRRRAMRDAKELDLNRGMPNRIQEKLSILRYGKTVEEIAKDRAAGREVTELFTEQQAERLLYEGIVGEIPGG